MDPFAVLNAAGNIAQFVGYARDVYVQIREIRSSVSGITGKNTDLIWSASELHDMVDNIRCDMSSFDHASTPTERRIRDIGCKCQDLARDLQEEIERKAAKDRSNFLTAFKSAAFGHWRPSEIHTKLGELDKLQDTLFKNLMVHISNQQNGLRTAVLKLAEQNRQLGVTRTDAITGLRDTLLTTIPSSGASAINANLQSPDSRFECIKDFVGSWIVRATSLQKEQQIIESLYFEDMPYRRDTIMDAWAETFRWIYDKRLHFKEWLEAEEDVYWISGAAGSGKSTLIKFLSRDNATHEDLLRWSGTKKLVKASFHFWFSGSDLQKSQEGLLRTLLFEIFRQCPSIIPAACPDRWQGSVSRPWSRSELISTIKRLDLQSPDARFCFFIDGLDEYQSHGFAASRIENAPATHMTEIIEAIATLSNLKDVKLCLSSRPWQAFEQAYGAYKTRKLYVDQENVHDIRLYVRDKFEHSDLFMRTQNGNRALEMAKIVEEIVRESKGVFLWVALVIESLLRGLSNQDHLAELKRRLSETPKTLNGMFERMLASVEDRYQQEAAQILSITLHARSPLKLFAYAHIGDHNYCAVSTPCRSWTQEECVALAEETKTRIKVRCPDLITVRDCMEPGEAVDAQASILVDFLHRTVGDFLSLEDTQARLKLRLSPDFDPGRYICEAMLGQIKGANPETSSLWDFVNADVDSFRGVQEDLGSLLHQVAREEIGSNKPQKALLDELQSVMILQGWNDPSVSFLGIMVASDLQLYVREYLPDAIRSHGAATPLLQCALMLPLDYSSICVSNGLSVGMVRLLLKEGTDPNEQSSTGEDTIWEHYLKDRYRKRKSQNMEISKKDQTHLNTIQVMLEHGADPNIRCLYKSRDGGCATMDLVEMLRDMLRGEGVEYVEAVIFHQRERVEREREISQAVSQDRGWGLTLAFHRLIG